jgi:hypothetical protein
MRRTLKKLASKYRFPATVAALILASTGCSEAKRGAAASVGTPLAAQKAVAAVSAVKVALVRPRSVFTVDENTRDPFFPKAKKRTLVAAVENSAPIDIPVLLQAEFQGVIASGESRIAVIGNVMLEAGRQAVIPVRSGGQERRVSVHCREVSRNAVVLEVQGYAEPLTITRLQR